MIRIIRPALSRISNLGALDARSLAAARMLLAAVLLADIYFRAAFLSDHYTDNGFMPRSTLLGEFADRAYVSLHLMSGMLWWQMLLFALSALAATALFVGLRTKWAAFACWILWTSLQGRNDMILHGGDVLIRMLLFWAMFLPLERRYSVDHALRVIEDPEPPLRVCTPATWAWIIQMALVYWFNAINKYHPEWYGTGDALYFALSLDMFATPFGTWLLQFPDLLRLLAFSALWLEIIAPMLLFIPIYQHWLRTLVVFAFLGFHLVGLTLTMDLGTFPYICAAGWLALLPGIFWDTVEKRLLHPIPKHLRIRFDGDCGFCRKMVALVKEALFLNEVPQQQTQDDPTLQALMLQKNSWIVEQGTSRHFGFQAITALFDISPLRILRLAYRAKPVLSAGEALYSRIAANRMRLGQITKYMPFRSLPQRSSTLGQVIAGAALAYIIMWNIRQLNFDYWTRYFPYSINIIANTLRIDQRWDMFAPYPAKDDGWFVFPGKLRNGKTIDVYAMSETLQWTRPADISFRNEREQKFMANLWQRTYSNRRLYVGRFFCRRWNATHSGDETLLTFKMVFMLERSEPPGVPTTVRPETVWDHNCFAADPPK